jgi:molecular chaperone DnaJ
MRLSEAYSILEVPENTSLSDVKKKYRDLSKKYHPDVNKEPGSEDKFKKINEAYARIQKGGSDEPAFNPMQGFHGFNPFDHFNMHPFANQNVSQTRSVDNIIIETTITFAESVLGVKKDLSFNRENKCADCNGNGKTVISNGCDKCGGKGQISSQQGNMLFVQTCNKCFGRTQSKSCTTCNELGYVNTTTAVSVNIPGGVSDKNILRLSGMGNFAGQFMSMDQFSDVHLVINVIKDENLKLENNIVIYNLNISLLEAIRGCTKSVPTVLGQTSINIKPLSKNNDEFIISRMGINRLGDQKVILNVEYPKDTTKLIDALLQTKE